jgi:hypothetical protein
LGEHHVRGQHHERAVRTFKLRRAFPRARSPARLRGVLRGLGGPLFVVEQAEVLVRKR